MSFPCLDVGLHLQSQEKRPGDEVVHPTATFTRFPRENPGFCRSVLRVLRNDAV